MRVDIAITSIGIALGKTLMLPPDDCHQHVYVDFFFPLPFIFLWRSHHGLTSPALSLCEIWSLYIASVVSHFLDNYWVICSPLACSHSPTMHGGGEERCPAAIDHASDGGHTLTGCLAVPTGLCGRPRVLEGMTYISAAVTEAFYLSTPPLEPSVPLHARTHTHRIVLHLPFIPAMPSLGADKMQMNYSCCPVSEYDSRL